MGHEKRRKSFSLDEEVVDWFQNRESVNASRLVNRLLQEYQTGGRAKDVALALKREELTRKIEDKQARIRRFESQISEMKKERDRLDKRLNNRDEATEQIVDELVRMFEDGAINHTHLEPGSDVIQARAKDAPIDERRLSELVKDELGVDSP